MILIFDFFFMNYVIQNFYQSKKLLTITPRLKLKIIFENSNLLSIILKFQFFFNKLSSPSLFFFLPYLFFLKYFFTRSIARRLFYFNPKYFFNYTNNFTKSLTYWALTFINLSLESKETKLLNNIKTNSLFYLYPIKNSNHSLLFNYYKNFFFFIMFASSNLWFQPFSLFKFYFNFILIFKNLQFFKIYNGHFFRIYNF